MRMSLTELEGAVLSEIHDRGHHSAFQVRRAFQRSPSTEWSGSAGAVYPAIRRLAGRGLVHSEVLPTARRASRLTLTTQGVEALEAWAMDVKRAVGVGLDPFRLRSGIWDGLSPERRRACLTRLVEAVEAEIAAITSDLDELDSTERTRASWAVILQRSRRDWLIQQLSYPADDR
jgi:DNA-binding PadR family transcriptional regulator